jgi:regulatory protein
MLPKIRTLAVKLLTIREHSQFELKQKLCQKAFPATEVEAVIKELADKKLQSDERFIEGYINMRKGRGFGPRRIQMELEQRGIAKEEAKEFSKSNDDSWTKLANEVRTKKFGKKIPEAYQLCLPQMRFLYYKGFTSDQIKKVFGHESVYDSEN